MNMEMGVDQTWQAWVRNDLLELCYQLLVVIRICVWIPDHSFISVTIVEYFLYIC